MFLDILIFEPNSTFCKGYRLCNMADFQNLLTSRIFGVFSSGFLHRTTLVCLYIRFSHVLTHFNFWPKLTILQRLQPLEDGRFLKSSNFSNIWCFFQRFFAQNNSSVLIDMFFRMFLDILVFEPDWPFCRAYSLCMDYSLCKVAEFQNRLISRIFGVFSSGFLHRTTLVCSYFCFWHVFIHFNFWPKVTILQRL